MIPRLNDQTFTRATQASSPVLITFSAPVRCHVCREEEPILKAMVADGYPVYTVDVEKPDSAQIEATLGGRGVPFHKVYANGQLLLEFLGKLDKKGLIELFRQANLIVVQSAKYRGSGGAFTSLAGFGRR